MSRPLVSVVIPYFNRAHTIRRALDSVMVQAYSPFEVVIVDDASSDSLEDALQDFREDPRIRTIRHEINKGVSAARNTGISNSRGDYVAFLDSDDYWLPAKLERQVAAAGRAPDPGRVICLAKTRILMPGGWTRVRPIRMPGEDESLARFLYGEGGFAQCSSFFVSSCLAREVKFRENMRQYEDHLFLIEAQARGGRLVTVDEELAVWVNDARPDRLSSADSVARAREFMQAAAPFVDGATLKAFEARTTCEIRWKESGFSAVSLLAQAVARRGMPVSQGLMLLTRMAAPRSAYERIKKMLTAAKT